MIGEFNKKLMILFVLSMIASAAVADSSLYRHNIKMIDIRQIDSIPIIDGQIDDECWQNTNWHDKFTLSAGKVGEVATRKTRFSICFSNQELYIAVRCEENNTSRIVSNASLWDHTDILFDDRISVLLDPGHTHRNFVELTVNSRGVMMDRSGFIRYPNTRTCDWNTGWNCRFFARTHVDSAGWNAEILIDLGTLEDTPVDFGSTWGFNLARVSRPAGLRTDELNHRKAHPNAEYSTWAPVFDGLWETISNFYEPVQFGDLVFGQPGLEVSQVGYPAARFNWGDRYTASTVGWNPLELVFGEVHNSIDDCIIRLETKSGEYSDWRKEKRFKVTGNQKIEFQFFIPAHHENRLKIAIFDSEGDRKLYETHYMITVPPFVSFDLEPLYSNLPAMSECPIRFRTDLDKQTRESCSLSLTIIKTGENDLLANTIIGDLQQSNTYQPVFETDNLHGLAGGNYEIVCRLTEKETGRVVTEFTQPFTKSGTHRPAVFGATEGEYQYGGLSDHAIRIHYPSGIEFVFWRLANYGPWWDLDQLAVNHEHVECWGSGTQGCCEIMQDRECRYSSVRLVENSPVRVVVHWRYALSDAHYTIHMNEWVDEYYYFYPDSVCVREIRLWANSSKPHEFFEILLVRPPGVELMQLFEAPLATMYTLDGRSQNTDWFWEHSMEAYYNFLESAEDFVFQLHPKDRPQPFVVLSFRDEILPGVSAHSVDLCSPRRSIDRGDGRGHWPASKYAIDGYNWVGNDRPRHGNIGSIHAEHIDLHNNPNVWTVLLGLEEPESGKSFRNASAWIHPAKLVCLTENAVSRGYNHQQRAHMLKVNSEQSRLTLELSSDNGVYNPVLIVDGWDRLLSMQLNGTPVSQKLYKSGITESGELVVFIDGYFERGLSLLLKGN